VRRALIEAHPWLALNLFTAFTEAKAEVRRYAEGMLAAYFDTGLLGADVRKALQADPLGYGLKAARRELETVARYVHEQGLTPRRVALEEIFAPSTLDL